MLKLKEYFERYQIEIWGKTVFITNKYFNFTYNGPEILMPEFREGARYVGGLQCEFDRDTPDYKTLENELCDIAEKALKLRSKSNG